MAAFTFESTGGRHIDWFLFRDGGIWLYFRREVLEADSRWFEDHNYVIYRFDCSTWLSVDDFHTDVSQKLVFPDYYGRNLDALNDCFRDLDLPDSGGILLELVRFDLFAQRHAKVAWHFLDIIADHSRVNGLLGRRLGALVQSDDPRISFQPVGCVGVRWNPDEWLSSRRGV